MSTEQTVKIIDAVSSAIDAANPEVTTVVADTNYWWLAIIAILPIIMGGIFAWFKSRKKT